MTIIIAGVLQPPHHFVVFPADEDSLYAYVRISYVPFYNLKNEIRIWKFYYTALDR